MKQQADAAGPIREVPGPTPDAAGPTPEVAAPTLDAPGPTPEAPDPTPNFGLDQVLIVAAPVKRLAPVKRSRRPHMLSLNGGVPLGHKFDPRDWERLESPDRRAMLPPDHILTRIGLVRGQTFVDVGAGTGYFALPAAIRVGPEGMVYAVDVARPMLELMEHRLAGKGLPIELVHSREADIPLPDALADHVFTSTVLHEVEKEQRIAFVKELVRLLKPGGRVTILDWAPVDERMMGPPSHIRLAKEAVDELLLSAEAAVTRSEFFGSELYIVQGTRG